MGVVGQIRLPHVPCLEIPAFHGAAGDGALKVVGAGLDREVGKAEFEGVAGCYGRAPWLMETRDELVIGSEDKCGDRKSSSS